MTQKTKMYEQILKHGENLNAIFNTSIEPVKLCKSLLRLEKKANHAATCLLNTNTLHLLELNKYTGYEVEQATEEQQEMFFDKILASVCKILGEKAKDVVFINYDARGYTLKLKSEYVSKLRQDNKNIFTDFGGYGILAPQFDGK